MPKTYFFKFGAIGASYAGLSPSFTVFQLETGTTSAPPGITARISGTGFYQFSFNGASYGATLAIAFTIDGSASIPIQDRFIQGVLDPIQAVDQTITPMSTTLSVIGASLATLGASLAVMGNSLAVMGGSLSAMGSTILAIGSSFGAIGGLIGDTTSSFGTTLTDPSTVFGYLKRNLEVFEGNKVFNKGTGVWDIYSRGSSTLLREKTFANTTSTTSTT